MHDIYDDRNQVPGANINFKDCISCGRSLVVTMFKRDSSYRDGRRDQCDECANSPKMSVTEHTHRLSERNYNSEAVKQQRFLDIEEYRNEAARVGHVMHHSEFLRKVATIAPNLLITDGRIKGDLAAFKVYGQPQPNLDNRSFEYLFYIPTGVLPEFSTVEFDNRDVPVREKQRGWRTILLRLIKSKVITEKQVNKVFGYPSGAAARRYQQQLFSFRNGL